MIASWFQHHTHKIFTKFAAKFFIIMMFLPGGQMDKLEGLAAEVMHFSKLGSMKKEPHFYFVFTL